METRECRKCHEVKPFSSFVKSKSGLHGICWTCRKCNSELWAGKRKAYRENLVIVPVERKKCPKCGKIKEAKEYYHNKSVKNGLHSQCKECINSDLKEKYWVKKAAFKDIRTVKTCNICHETKPIDQFDKLPLQPDGRRNYCYSCRNNMSRERNALIIAAKKEMQQKKLAEEGIFFGKTKRCYSCKEVKPLEMFDNSSSSPDKKSGACKECEKVYRRRGYLKNIDTYRKKAKEKSKSKEYIVMHRLSNVLHQALGTSYRDTPDDVMKEFMAIRLFNLVERNVLSLSDAKNLFDDLEKDVRKTAIKICEHRVRK